MNRNLLFTLIIGMALAACRGESPALEEASQIGATPRRVNATPGAATRTPAAPQTSTPTPFLPASKTPTPRQRDHPGLEVTKMILQSPTPSPTLPVEQRYPQAVLPDLITLPPTDLHLVIVPSSGRRLVRFTNAILNRGPGHLELVGRPGPASDHIQVEQNLLDDQGEVVNVLQVGEFIFHQQHNHWHLEGFVLYEVWSVTKSGKLGANATSGTKLSYCLLDTDRTDIESPGPEYPRWPRYTTCSGNFQGLSPGWIDVYERHLAGQWVEVTDLPDGVYALASTVNPDQHVIELDGDNNTGMTYIVLEDNRLRVLEDLPEEADTEARNRPHPDNGEGK